MSDQVYKVRDPAGNLREIRGPAGATDEQVIAKAKELFAEADKPAKPAVVSVGESLRQIPRQIGLTLRYGAEGLADVADIPAGAIAGAYNTAADMVAPGGYRFPAGPTRTATSGVLDALGVPTPQNATERVVGDMSRMVAGGGGIAGLAGKAARVATSPAAKSLAEGMALNPGTQALSAAGAGGSGGAVREAGGGPGEQFVASVAGGLGVAGVAELAKGAYDGLKNAITSWRQPDRTMTQVNVVLNQILEKNGIDVAQIPGKVRAELAFDVKKALDTGKELNPDVVRRLADYAAVGAKPTRGSVTLDPVQITQERNLAKLGANSRDPALQELAQVQNANNAKLIENLNTLGGGTPNASNPMAAGEKVLGVIAARDARAKGVENALYAKARDSQGRALDLDSEGFVAQAYDNLAKSNKGAFLPENIARVLDQIRTGKVVMGGKEYPTPFTVDSIDNIKTMLATASRGATDGNTRAAIREVRQALENVQPRAVGRQVGGTQVVEAGVIGAAQGKADDLAGEAMSAFDRARRFSRARRTWQESAPGIEAALDDAKPDTFVREYILGASNKASAADAEKLMFAIKKDPAAFQAVKENVVGYLKSKALSKAEDEVGNFSQSAYNGALKELQNKLHLFFSKDEIAQLKAIGRVASYEMVQPKGSAVNNSNTAGTFAGILDRIASSGMLGKIPFGEAAIRTPAKNWSAQIGTERALDAGGAITRVPQSPEVRRLEQLIGPGLLLAAPSAKGRNDEKRN